MSDELSQNETPRSPRPPSEARNENAKGVLLPGIAAIALYMLFMAFINAFGALRGMFRTAAAGYGVLAVCTLLAIGVFGLLRMRRWGWALVLAGTLLAAAGSFYKAHVEHDNRNYVMAGLNFIFFLYLIRTQVRERMRPGA